RRRETLRVPETIEERDSFAEALSTKMASHFFARLSVSHVPCHELFTACRFADAFLCCHSTKDRGVPGQEIMGMSQVGSQMGERIHGFVGKSWIAALIPNAEAAHVGFVRRAFIGDVVLDEA